MSMDTTDVHHEHAKVGSWGMDGWGPTSFPSQFPSIGSVFALQFANPRHLCQPLCSTEIVIFFSSMKEMELVEHNFVSHPVILELHTE